MADNASREWGAIRVLAALALGAVLGLLLISLDLPAWVLLPACLLAIAVPALARRRSAATDG